MDILSDFKNYDKIFPFIKDTNIIQKNENQTVTKEILFVGSKNYEFEQKSSHTVTSSSIETNTLSGPLKGSKLQILFKPKNLGTQVVIHANLKLGFKYVILTLLLKKKYKLYLEKSLIYANELANLTPNRTWGDSISNDGECLIISKKYFENVKLFGWWKSEMNEIFNDEIYGFLPVNNKIVVDIGANIGDSSIYFSKKNAKMVLAIEPFPKNILYAQKNIQANNLEEKIKLFNTACTDKVKKIKLDPIKEGTGLHLSNAKDGIEIQTTTLEQIVNDFNLDQAILKMDCEDCEYESILSSDMKTIQSFSHILIEYHHGHEKLKTKLENCRFHISIKQNQVTNSKTSGYIYATNMHFQK